jgi:hypothetical protein
VLIRSTGEPTYFLSDIAYHRDKMDRGFAHMIDVWGADHHGYVPRMKAAFTALPPHDPGRLELIIGQLVNLLESGETKRMSKRRGDIVTVDDLVDAIGVDAARFLLVGRSHDTTLELDIDVAREQSNKNPVYYVQYAHARICSILRALDAEGAGGGPAGEVPPAVEVGAHERALARALARYPSVLLAAAETRAPHRLNTYLSELAAEFHVFYRHCRVLVDDAGVAAFRAGLCRATRDVLAGGLALLGVSGAAPPPPRPSLPRCASGAEPLPHPVAQLGGLLGLQLPVEPQHLGDGHVVLPTQQAVDHAVEHRLGYLAPRDRRRVHVRHSGLILLQQVLLDKVVHDRHHRGVGDLTLRAQSLVHLAHGGALELPHHREDVRLQRADAGERRALGAAHPRWLGRLIHHRSLRSVDHLPDLRPPTHYERNCTYSPLA